MSTVKFQQALEYVNERIVKNGAKGIDGQELNQALNKILEALAAMTLQQVLEAGSSSDKELLLSMSGDGYERIVKMNKDDLLFYIRGMIAGVEHSSRFQALPGEVKWAAQKGTQLGQILLYPDAAIFAVPKIIFEAAGSDLQLTLLARLLTRKRTIDFPDADGTLALQEKTILLTQKGAPSGVGTLTAAGTQTPAEAYMGMKRKDITALVVAGGYAVQPADNGHVLDYYGSSPLALTVSASLGDAANTTTNGFACAYRALGTGPITPVAGTGASLRNPYDFFNSLRYQVHPVVGMGGGVFGIYNTVE